MNEPVAFVTGVSRGLGAALATTLLARGFDVVGLARSAPDGHDHPRFGLVACDLAHPHQWLASVEAAFARFAASAPRLAVLVNNAAVAFPVGRLGSLDRGEIERALAVNLAAPAILANAFCRAFGPPGERRVINVSSGAAAMPLPGSALYCAAKAGLEALTRTLAAERTDDGFHAVAIRPGVVDTPMQAFMRAQPRERLPDVDLFVAYHRDGRLAPPGRTAAAIVDRLVLGPVDNGRAYSIGDLES